MTGKEVILYILQNNLENEVILKDNFFFNCINEKEVAIKFEVGIATVKTWYERGLLPGVKLGNSIFFSRDILEIDKEAFSGVSL